MTATLAPLDLIDLVGADIHLTPDELDARAPSATWLARTWEVYGDEHDTFVGATLDPLAWRLSTPVTRPGAPRFHGRAVLIVGTGPSLGPALPSLGRLRDRLCLVTSPRGAEALADHGLTPDLVLVEHASPIDAQLTLRHLGDRGGDAPMHRARWIGVTSHTPPALLAGADPSRAFVMSPAPTWGCWPATATAMAARGDAARVGLIGVDLGSPHAPDPSMAATRRLLSLVADAARVPCLDCGAGAFKEGWGRATLDELAGSGAPPVTIDWDAAPPRGAERARTAAGLSRLQPVIAWARGERAVAEAARDGRAAALAPALRQIAGELGRLGARAGRRRDLQETLGVSFAPRLWRTGIDPALGPALWRPVLLALDEIVRQADLVSAAVARAESPC